MILHVLPSPQATWSISVGLEQGRSSGVFTPSRTSARVAPEPTAGWKVTVCLQLGHNANVSGSRSVSRKYKMPSDWAKCSPRQLGNEHTLVFVSANTERQGVGPAQGESRRESRVCGSPGIPLPTRQVCLWAKNPDDTGTSDPTRPRRGYTDGLSPHLTGPAGLREPLVRLQKQSVQRRSFILFARRKFSLDSHSGREPENQAHTVALPPQVSERDHCGPSPPRPPGTQAAVWMFTPPWTYTHRV